MKLLCYKDIAGVAFITLFMIAVVIITWKALERIEIQTKDNARDALSTVLHTTQETLHIWIDQRKRDIVELASSPNIQNLTQQLLREPRNHDALVASPALAEIRNLITPKLSEYADHGFFVIAPDMLSIASLHDRNIGTINLIHRQCEEKLASVFDGNIVFIPTIYSDIPLPDNKGKFKVGLPTTFVVSPIRNTNNNIVAALALRMDPTSQFTRIAQLGRIGKTGETYAFDKEARLITDSRFEQQLRNVGYIKPGGQSILAIKVTDPGGNLLDGFTPSIEPEQRKLTEMAVSAVSGKSAYNTEGYRDYRGVEVFGVWTWDQDLDFGLATEINVEEALQPFYATRQVIISILVAVVLLSLILTTGLLWIRKQSNRWLEKAYAQLEIRVDERTRELSEARDKLEKLNSKLAVLATTDSLTGLANRRSFTQRLEEEWLRCRRYGQSVSIIMMDIDFFKLYNDHYGHLLGDECLMRVAMVLRKNKVASRPDDTMARYGGEEFIILLSGTRLDDAMRIAEDIRQGIIAENIQHMVTQVPGMQSITASFGVACQEDCTDLTAMELVGMADQALYKAKTQGRNQVASFR